MAIVSWRNARPFLARGPPHKFRVLTDCDDNQAPIGATRSRPLWCA
jgi:hypothetical protein